LPTPALRATAANDRRPYPTSASSWVSARLIAAVTYGRSNAAPAGTRPPIGACAASATRPPAGTPPLEPVSAWLFSMDTQKT
jgi:hypothetical protein